MTIKAPRPWLAWRKPASAAAFAGLLALFALVMGLVAGGRFQGRHVHLSVSANSAARDSVAGRSDLPLADRGVRRIDGQLQLELPARAQGEPRRLLWLSRDPLRDVWLQTAHWRSDVRHFFRPGAEDGLFAPAFLFALPDGAVEGMELHAVTASGVRLAPMLISEDEAALWTQRIVAMNVLTYSGTFVLALLALALLWTLQERYFLFLFAAAATTGLMFGARNGHLYSLPGLRAFGYLEDAGLWALTLLCLASQLALAAQVAPPRPLLARWVRWAVVGLVAAALLSLPGWEPVSRWTQAFSRGAYLVANVAVVALLVGGARRREPMALPALLLALLTLVMGLARIAMRDGAMADAIWVRYGAQLSSLALMVVLALGLLSRVGVYREQRDRERDARVDSERRMEREAARTALTRAFQSRLGEMAPADVEWTAFRLMLEHLLPQVPAISAAVVAHGYHGRDVAVAEPFDDRDILDGLQDQRMVVLRRQALAGVPLQQPVTVGNGKRIEALVPIPVGQQGWGALLLQRESEEGFGNEELAMAAEFARLTILHANEAAATQALRRTAELDALTGTFNRRSIDQWLARRLAYRNDAGMVALLFVDIDHFKRINDLHGHACGDHCLRQVAMALRGALCPEEVLGRYGGEEFVALLPGSDVATARETAERMRSAIEDDRVEWQGGVLHMTVSIGVAVRHSDEQAASLFDRADRALYAAKREGRNRVCVSRAIFPH